MACGRCLVEGCGRLMRRTGAGTCQCPLHPENGTFPEISGGNGKQKGVDVPVLPQKSKKATKGSPSFTKTEIKRGFRRL